MGYKYGDLVLQVGFGVVSIKKFKRYRNLNNWKVVEALCSRENEEG
jgi:hypothetical protein